MLADFFGILAPDQVADRRRQPDDAGDRHGDLRCNRAGRVHFGDILERFAQDWVRGVQDPTRTLYAQRRIAELTPSTLLAARPAATARRRRRPSS